MKYKLKPEHTYIVILAFFVLSAGIKFTAEQVYAAFAEPPVRGVELIASPAD